MSDKMKEFHNQVALHLKVISWILFIGVVTAVVASLSLLIYFKI